MADSQSPSRGSKASNGFRISAGPLIRFADDEQLRDLGDVVELPRISAMPVLFAIARDPRTIFTYWDIDWRSIFAQAPPLDRQVHLRIYLADGAQESSSAVEPMAGNCYLKVAQPRGAYRVEIGYYQPEKTWNRVATSEQVTMPPDSISDDLDVDLATLPFHLSFQRLIDVFRTSNKDALAEIISKLQGRALTEQDRALLTPEEWEVLRAVNLSLDEIGSAQRAFLAPMAESALRRRAEAVLGLGSTSPANGFGGSSWS